MLRMVRNHSIKHSFVLDTGTFQHIVRRQDVSIMHVLAFNLADYIRADRSISTLSNVSTHNNPRVGQLSLGHSRLGRLITTYQTITQQHPISIHCWFRVSSFFEVNINAGGRRFSSKGFLYLSHWVTRSFSILRQNTCS